MDIRAASREILSSGVQNRSDTNRAVQLHRTPRGLKFRIEEVGDCTNLAKTKALLFFAYAKAGFLMTRLKFTGYH